jgi:hypothetical protein
LAIITAILVKTLNTLITGLFGLTIVTIAVALRSISMADRLVALLGFVRAYKTVEEAIAAGAQQPFTSDPTMNAYDFRPRSSAAPRPSVAMTLKGLAALGIMRPAGYERRIFVAYELDRIHEYLRHSTGEYMPESVAHFVCMFRHYTELKEGRKARWKLLKS